MTEELYRKFLNENEYALEPGNTPDAMLGNMAIAFELYQLRQSGYVTPSPQPTPEPELPKPNDEVPGYKWVTVIEKVPLREIYRYNAAGSPIWGVYGKRIIGNRIIPKAGKKLLVARKPIKGDGGNEAYLLHPDQIVDGHLLRNEKQLFVLVRHVRG